MTADAPAPAPLAWTDDPSTWCTSCSIHLATTRRPICPVCDDIAKKAAKA
jgi:hypothetical protein